MNWNKKATFSVRSFLECIVFILYFVEKDSFQNLFPRSVLIFVK